MKIGDLAYPRRLQLDKAYINYPPQPATDRGLNQKL